MLLSIIGCDVCDDAWGGCRYGKGRTSGRAIVAWATVDVQALDLATAEFRAHAITVNVAGIEIFGFRFGASPQDIARAVAKEIAGRVCRGGSGSNGIQA